MSTGSHAGSNAGNALRKGVGLVHVSLHQSPSRIYAPNKNKGAGEAIRGNLNAAVDSAAGDREGAARNEAIASRGADEMENGHYHGTGAGVTPHDTARERQNRALQGEYNTRTTAGPHLSDTANRVDPRYDSEFGTRR
jgi:hypothetical protein